MFEILKVFIEQVVKLVNVENLLKERDKKKVSAIGAELFSLYTNLNAIYVTGLKIIEEIDDTIDRWDRYRREKRVEEPIYFYSLQTLLEIQRRNIVWFGQSFVSLSRYLDVIDPKTARAVALFLSTKSNIISTLIGQLSTRNTRIHEHGGTPYEQPPLLFSASFEDSLLETVRLAETQQTTGSALSFIENRELLKRVDDSGADTIELHRLSSTEVTFLRSYLRNRKPAKQLEALRLMLDQLHEKLIANFELKDVLLSVGQNTSQTSQDNWVHWSP